MKAVKFPAMILVAICLLSCGRYVVHPGAVNTFDSASYDALMTAKITIDTAREQFAAKTLPDSLKPAINELIKAYDTAFPIYKDWRETVQAGKPADGKLAQLNAALLAVTKALTTFKGGH